MEIGEICELAQGHKWECNEMVLHIQLGHCLASPDLSDKLEHAEQLHPVLALPFSSSDIFEVRQAPPAAQQTVLSHMADYQLFHVSAVAQAALLSKALQLKLLCNNLIGTVTLAFNTC